ncbi:MAG: NAD(P)/FAD-dependent oxidoreductase [Spirochaetales bacterium]|nr:NAD(P)/FAD-dependent oxidoreductase [Spirochaetales bacterium]
MKPQKIVIVGAGISGLTAGAYLLQSGHSVLILEKTSQCGGLVSSFSRDGFLFDAGPRAFGNAGILVPMLEDLGINLPLIKGLVSTGIKKEIVHFDSNRGISDYIASLHKLFPESRCAIKKIEKRIRSHSRDAHILNKVANPFFKNAVKDHRYLWKNFLPWLPFFLRVVVKNIIHKKSIEEVLDSVTDNTALKDMVCQHFFKGTPANFAFGYFENYQDYKYPPGGTGKLPQALESKIIHDGGEIIRNSEIVKINPGENTLLDQNGKEYIYDQLLWAADLKSLYQRLDDQSLAPGFRRSISLERRKYLTAHTAESVFTLFVAVNETPEVFKKISNGHFIYTPLATGMGDLHRSRLATLKRDFGHITKQELFAWLREYCERNSYEISIPVVKDPSLAPKNKTGLVISLLFDGELFLKVEQAGWIDEFREKITAYMLHTLESSIYPGLKEKIIFQESATPITVMKMFHTANGAITGWSLEQKAPVPDSLAGILSTPNTAIPRIYKAGQWSYSPSGVPIAILTGRIAAAAMIKSLSKSEKPLYQQK